MKTRNRFSLLASLGLAAVLGIGAAFMNPPAQRGTPGKAEQDAKAEIGKAAPDFTLKDVDGKEYKLSDYKGKHVVLQWINPQCPVCARVSSSGLVEQMRKELKALDKDVVHVAINSTHNMTAEDSVKYLKANKLEDVVALDDSAGEVGRLYGAKTTPHIFVIDAKGVLRYSGAFDDDPSGRKSERINYAVNALRQILAGETVVPEKTQPYGCNVKYKGKR